MVGRETVSFLKAVYAKWDRDNVPQLAAALAYYTVFSFAPLLVILIALGGIVLGKQAVQEHILTQASDILGDRGAHAIESVIGGITRPSTSIIASAISFGVLLFGASRVLAQLHDALSTIWEVDRRGAGRRIVQSLKDRTHAFLVVLAAGFLLISSLVINTLVATIVRYFESYLPGGNFLWRQVDLLVSFGVLTLSFAMIFKVLPRVKIAWRDVWLGATATTLLFTAARYLLAFYLQRGAMGSVYGAASSFFVILFWFYVSTSILLIGAECTQVYATRYGSHRGVQREP